MSTLLPWLMSAITIAVMWLAGNQWRYTWHLSFVNQALWITWIIGTQSWGFIPMNVCMWIVSARNLRKWSARAARKAQP
jgi:hypothetical protein